ncbi:nicotinate-nucleotide adenylyltransferase [Alkalicoccobacillus murimartini]|uniref:Probable nicotinate-nucleotide adenylyltransferase n=1 Tax=Alkalicoccobacillus murimartini TaxID=171685 RepID=A0ABT9YCD6_9BACI|nr:nicotinate-nucleotide adenylyltransferase [Alkalicoccobacillus murimartini]MDQ0205507.1 nicotinate-nucleotide adenylyltransferase [Alkalicoccobacillus murimartini]
MSVKKIGLFGGTFDPPHLGHMLMAEEALHECHLDEIWFIPVSTPPHKEREVTPGDMRFEMLVRSTSEEPRFQVSDAEIKRQGRSYTVDTVKHFTSQYKDHEFYFIIGGDMVESLSEWKDIDTILELVTFIGFKRSGSSQTPRLYKDRIHHLDLVQVDFSSSHIRERIQAQKPIRYMVPDSVHSYIMEGGLYGAKPCIRAR